MKPIRKTLKEKGWMLKMAGTSISSRMGSKVIGKYGTYLIKKKIGNGGNGVVFVADIIEGGESLPQKSDYAIKFLDVAPNEEKKLEKRKLRFRKEIETVLSFQDKVSGIIPIYDTSVYCEEEPDVLWYLMPKAEQYNPQKFSVLQKMEQMFDLGNCIRQLHKLGFVHRDIKPKNLLLFDGRLCLSDFGLVRNIADTDEHITEMNEPLGPRAIRPPEFQSIEEINGVDYQKSDVYLYAKTIWMVLNCNNSGFLEEYSRNRNAVYIDKDKLQIETAEPLHRLMEEATKHYYWERIDIEGCLDYVEAQLRVIRGTMPRQTLMDLKYDEQAKHNSFTIPSDEQIYKEPDAILKILNNMAHTVGLVFIDAGKESMLLPLKKARYIEDNLYEIEILNPYYGRRKKVIEIAIDDICMKKDMTYTLHSVTFSFDEKPVPLFSRISDGLRNGYKRIRLNTNYLIKMVKLTV